MSKPGSPSGLAGLDWLNFFVATLQTGFGPFIAVYLTSHRWTQASIATRKKIELSASSEKRTIGDWLRSFNAVVAGFVSSTSKG